MKIKNNEQLSKMIILEHYENPSTKKSFSDDLFIKERENYTSCIDNIEVGLKIKDNVIQEAQFDGVACAISTSATDIILNMIKGKTIIEVENIINEFIKLTIGQDYDEDLLNELNAFSNVHKHPIRVKCAQLAIKPISRIFKRYQNQKG